MTKLRWLNIELYENEFGDKLWKVIAGELKAVAVSQFSNLTGYTNQPQFLVQTINGHMVAVLDKSNVVRLLVPTMGS